MVHTAYRLRQIFLIISDLVALALGLWGAMALRQFSLPTTQNYLLHARAFFFVFCSWLVINYVLDLYRPNAQKASNWYRQIFKASIAAFLFGITIFYITPDSFLTPKTLLILNTILTYSFIALWRFLFRTLFSGSRLVTNVLLVGHNEAMQEMASMLHSGLRSDYKLAAWVDPSSSVQKAEFKHVRIFHNIKKIRPAIMDNNIQLVIIAPDIETNGQAMNELYELLFWDVRVLDLARFYETITGRIPPYTFSEGWFLEHIKTPGSNTVYTHIRSTVDYLFALILLSLFLLLYIPIALAIKIESRGPVLFRQKRIGKSDIPFFVYKFRSMYALSKDGSAEKDGAQFTTKNDKRITRVGAFLRKTRLDEFPQSINILKGELSIIGPRPERPEIVQALESAMPYYPLRHIVKPGITGWAQVNQHYTADLETSLQKLQYDLYYIKNRSFLVDLSILLRTVRVVVRLMGQ